MSMTVDVSVNGQPIRRLTITNKTKRSHGNNTYAWIYTDLANDITTALLSTKSGELDHLMEDGAMVLISEVAAAAAETETVQ